MVFFFTLMISIVMIQVIRRFIFEDGFSWGEEVTKILFVWMSFASFGYLTRNGRHVRVGFFAGKLPKTAHKALIVLCDVLFLYFSAVGLSSSVSLGRDAIRVQDQLTAVPWNYRVRSFAGVRGFFMMTVRNIQVLIYRFRNWGTEMERFENYDGVYFTDQKICFAPKEQDVLEQMAVGAEEMLEKGE